MQLDTGLVIKTLTGEAYKTDKKSLTLGDVIAEGLATDQSGGKMKMYLLAEKCYSGKKIERDQADLSIIKKSVEECKTYNNLILGQALLLLENVK